MLASIEPRSLDSPTTSETEGVHSEGERDRRDEEQAFGSSHSAPFSFPSRRQPSSVDETEHQTRSTTAVGTSTNFIKRKTSQLLEAISPAPRAVDAPLSPQLLALVEAFGSSDIAAELRQEIDEAATQSQDASLPDVAVENSLTRGRQRASWGTQFRILSGRAFKNLYRDPALLATHYVSAIVLACTCSTPLYPGRPYSRRGQQLSAVHFTSM